MSALTVIRNTTKEERIESLEKRVSEMEKFIKTHLHGPSGQAY